MFWLNHAGLTNFNLVEPNALAWGLVLELLILSALLIGRFRFTLRQKMPACAFRNCSSATK